MNVKKVKIDFHDVKDFLPAQHRWCLCITTDLNTKKKTIRTAYNDDGFWDTNSSKAEGIGNVSYWVYPEEIEID
jgi:hypothetical protein